MYIKRYHYIVRHLISSHMQQDVEQMKKNIAVNHGATVSTLNNEFHLSYNIHGIKYNKWFVFLPEHTLRC